MHPQIQALYELQQRDRQLTGLERKLRLIPQRLKELEDDLGRLENLLASQRRKLEDTHAFRRSQEFQLSEEEEQLRSSRAKLQQVKNPRELNALQREIEQTRRMAGARSEEIEKIKAGVKETEGQITAVGEDLANFRATAVSEKERLLSEQTRLEERIGKLRSGRTGLTEKLDRDVLRTYDRIRHRVGGIAFVAAAEGRCLACKMHVPHQVYTQLRKGEEILACESCGRLLYWIGHFPKEEEKRAKELEAKPKASPPQRRPGAKDDEPGTEGS